MQTIRDCRCYHGSFRTSILSWHQQLLLPYCSASSSRGVATHVFERLNDQLADRTREVWDDEEDIQAAVERLGLHRAKQQTSGPLFSEINKLYIEQQTPDGYVGQLEVRYLKGKGYGLVASTDISKGQVIAICPPLTWISSAPGQPPSLQKLISHMCSSKFSLLQRRVLLSMCSLTALDDAHDQQLQEQQQQQQQDRLLRAAEELTQNSNGPGLPVSSLALSKSAALQGMQRQLQEAGVVSSNNGDDDDYDDCDGNDDFVHRDGTSYNSDTDIVKGNRTTSSTSSRSTGPKSLQHVDEQYRRLTPDLLELLECTMQQGSAGAAAAAGSSWLSSRTGAEEDSSYKPLDMPLDRLAALVCRNALMEMGQDLLVTSSRADSPASVTGIWPLLTAFNHSCAPNAVAVVVGDVAAGQQLEQQLLLGAGKHQRLTAAKQQLSPEGQQQAALADRQSGSSGEASTAAQSPPSNIAQRASSQPVANATSSISRGNSSLGVRTGSAGSASPGPGVGPFVLVRPVADLKAGDEVTLDYLSALPEGGLVYGAKRAGVLAQRWGFRCRCERCLSEAKLGPGLTRSLTSANSLAARLGPEIAAAARSGDIAALGDAASDLRDAIQEVEQQVSGPTVPGRVAGWAHASIYQAHALLAIAKTHIAPNNVTSLACIGTAMELAGIASPGSTAQLLGAGTLVVAAHEAWGPKDSRVEGAARALMEVLQLRYGPMEAGVSNLLAVAAQNWAHLATQNPVGLAAPAAAAAACARRQQALHAAAAADAAVAAGIGVSAKTVQSASSPNVAAAAAAAAAGKSDGAVTRDHVNTGEDFDEVAAALELEAEDVLEVTDEMLEQFYGDDGAGQQQHQQQQGGLADGVQSETGSINQAGMVAVKLQGLDSETQVLIKMRNEQKVLQELQLYAGYREAQPDLLWQQEEQQQPVIASQHQQHQQQSAEQLTNQVAGTDTDSARAAVGQQGDGTAPGLQPAVNVMADAVSAASDQLPPLSSWLQAGPLEQEEELLIAGQLAQPVKPASVQPQQQQRQPQAHSTTENGASLGNSSRAAAGNAPDMRHRKASRVTSLFAKAVPATAGMHQKQQQQKQRQSLASATQQQQPPPQQQHKNQIDAVSPGHSLHAGKQPKAQAAAGQQASKNRPGTADKPK